MAKKSRRTKETRDADSSSDEAEIQRAQDEAVRVAARDILYALRSAVRLLMDLDDKIPPSLVNRYREVVEASIRFDDLK